MRRFLITAVLFASLILAASAMAGEPGNKVDYDRPQDFVIDYNIFYNAEFGNFAEDALPVVGCFDYNVEGTENPYIGDPCGDFGLNYQPSPNGPACNGSVPVATVPDDGWFEQTCYLGAIDPADDWTEGWTFWLVDGAGRTDLKDELGAPVIVEGHITSNTTWVNTQRYLLRGGVFVDSGAVLTIEPGTIIFGEGATLGMLVVSQGAMIMAEGTREEPIIFTSDAEPGFQTRAQWGGLIICGYADINTGETAEGEGGTGTYGGNNDFDNSGVLSYVRVEFAGNEFTPENELNGIAFQGVGAGTTVEYIQVHMNKDDGIEMFGGNVDMRHCVVSGAADDQFDWTDGWRGRAQYVLLVQYGDGATDQGVEADNRSTDNNLLPRSNPQCFNFTVIGGRNCTGGGGKGDVGLLFRAGTAVEFCNSIIGPGFGKKALDIDDAGTFALPCGTTPATYDECIQSGCSGLRGDPTGDGSVNVLDVLAVANDILGIVKLQGDAICRADCNGDATINILDALNVANVILGIIPGCPGGSAKVDIYPETLELLKVLELYLSPQDHEKFTAMVKTVGVPTGCQLSQNYPNPFNPETVIEFSVPQQREVKLSVYNIMGQEVRVLVDGQTEAGYHTVTFDAGDLASGVYFYRLQAGSTVMSQKMVLVQ